MRACVYVCGHIVKREAVRVLLVCVCECVRARLVKREAVQVLLVEVAGQARPEAEGDLVEALHASDNINNII